MPSTFTLQVDVPCKLYLGQDCYATDSNNSRYYKPAYFAKIGTLYFMRDSWSHGPLHWIPQDGFPYDAQEQPVSELQYLLDTGKCFKKEVKEILGAYLNDSHKGRHS